MEKVGEDEKKTIEEASNSVEETRTPNEDERIRAIVSEEGSMNPSFSNMVAFKDPDFNESEMEEEEKVLRFFRRNNGLIPKYSERNKSERMVLEFQEDTPAETEQTHVVFDSTEIANLDAMNLNSPEILEGIKSSSASNEDTEDSSSNSDLDLSRYYFDGSLPVSAHVEESETHQDEERPLPKDENQMPLLSHKQPLQQPTSWRNCCGLLQLLRAADSRLWSFGN